jgi:nucleosome binding factor SPN SPT16 subunit
MTKFFSELTKNIFLQKGRIGNVCLDESLVPAQEYTSTVKKLLRVFDNHACIAVNNEQYENILVLTRRSIIKDLGSIKHTTKHIVEGKKNLLGWDDNQYVVIKPIYRVKGELLKITEKSEFGAYWVNNKESIYEAIKSEINNPDSIIELSELLRKLGT